MEQRLVPELLQDQFTASALVAAAEPLLDHGSPERQRVLDGYAALHRKLGEPGVTRRAAAAVLDQVVASPCLA
jgi:lipid-A-disaccharide synthase